MAIVNYTIYQTFDWIFVKSFLHEIFNSDKLYRKQFKQKWFKIFPAN